MNQTVVSAVAAEHVKNIIDSNRCTVCDKLNGKRMRYPCGHTSCDDCVPATECCPFCLTPQDSSTFAAPSIDSPYTHRCQKASNLLEAFQNEFGLDVYRRQRLSEQLKVEKEVFPQCIQAPAKYFNKRKSSKLFAETNKENISVFPGEELSPIKMENSNANVREWLNKCVKRKPLGDLNHSRAIINTIRKQPSLNTQNIDKFNRKRNHLEIWSDDNKSSIDEQVKASKKFNKENKIKKLEIKTDSTEPKRLKNKNDSGVSMDDDGTIIIDDSQSIRVDKDMNAWLAVLEAEKNEHCASTITLESKLTHELTQPKLPLKVPFYIKGPLCYNCDQSNDINALNNDVEIEEQPNVSITVESKNFTAIINVSKSERCNKMNTKQSVEVQTEFNSLDNFVDQGFVDEKYEKNEPAAILPIPGSSKSEIGYLDEDNNVGLVNKSVKTSNIVIAESDSDEDIQSTSLVVTADVHRSYEEILVLDDIDDLQEHSKRARRTARGYTPTSTDSSDKENYNPNRMKKSINSKKKPVKK